MNTPTAVYRFFGAHDVLLYVGMTGDLDERFAFHAKKAPWWPDAMRHEVEWFASREEGLAAEISAIESERPLWNSAGGGGGRPPTGKTPVRNLRMPDALWGEVAAMAATNGETMPTLITRLLEDFVSATRSSVDI